MIAKAKEPNGKEVPAVHMVCIAVNQHLGLQKNYKNDRHELKALKKIS